MLVKAIKTRAFIPPKDDLFSLLKESLPKLKEKSVVAITSKIVSISQGRCVKDVDKDELTKQEADLYLDRSEVPHKYTILTIKDNILIPTAGIDESNAKGYYILWPKEPYKVAKEIYQFIKEEYNLKEVGIIITDSHTVPLRTGIMGIGISYYGFNPLRDYRGKEDIFGREMKISQTNIVDSLATAAVYEMGEGSEQTPLAIIEDVELEFGDFPGKENPLIMNKEEDIYKPLINSAKWQQSKRTQQ